MTEKDRTRSSQKGYQDTAGETDTSGNKADRRIPEEDDSTDGLVDQGSIRTAAFSRGNEPRSNDSLENRGITQGSNDDEPGH